MPRNSLHSIRQLAGLYGVHTVYSNARGRHQQGEPSRERRASELAAKTPYSLEALPHMLQILATLRIINHLRRQGISGI